MTTSTTDSGDHHCAGAQTYGASSIAFDQSDIASGECSGGLAVSATHVEHDTATCRYSHDNLTSQVDRVKSLINVSLDRATLVINAT